MAMAIILIITKGTQDNQASIFNRLLTSYIDETAASINIDPSQYQLADINSVFAQSSGLPKNEKKTVLNTIQDNSVVSRATILTDFLEEFSDRGNQVTVYTVQEGDTVSFIASDYGVSVNTIIAANNLKSADEIKPGMELKIPPVDGVIHKIKKGDTVQTLATKYGVEAEKIISFNDLPLSGELEVDREIMIPGGKLPRPAIPTRIAIAKRFAYLPNLNEYFALPAVGFNWGRIHGRNGVDVANSCRTPIYAAADGKVTLALGSGWNGGFGKFVKLVHANGTETLYAHLSKLVISTGEQVLKNQQIGLMGSTGRSTGCHLHFEVHGARNPLAKY